MGSEKEKTYTDLYWYTEFINSVSSIYNNLAYCTYITNSTVHAPDAYLYSPGLVFFFFNLTTLPEVNGLCHVEQMVNDIDATLEVTFIFGYSMCLTATFTEMQMAEGQAAKAFLFVCLLCLCKILMP